ncbi:MAG: VCBS repeat-containing protein [Planctomycetota bacterium]
MIGLALLLAGLGGEASYVDASVRVDGTLLDWHFVDVEGDGKNELGVAIRTPRGRRELHLFRTSPTSIEREPYRKIPILDDIIAWTFADVRPDLAGRELVLLTRLGAWSFDPRKTGYRDNIAKLCETELLYDVPSPRALPYWSYVVEGGRNGDALLLPQRTGFSIYGPVERASDDALPFGPIATFRAPREMTPIDPEDVQRRQDEAQRNSERRSERFSLTIGDAFRPFLGREVGESLVDDSVRLQAPAFVDLDGDGRRDMLLLDGDRLSVHMASADGIPERPTRVETLPDYLRHDERRAALRLVDIDGDGREDVLGVWNEETDAIENGQWRIYVMRATKDALLPAKPTQVLRFEAGTLYATVADVDGDGRPDLALRNFDFPSMIDTVTGIEFRYSQLLYLGTKRGVFDRRPALKKERVYDEESVQQIISKKVLQLDCSGDGIADLVEVDLYGRVGVRRLRRDSSLFGGTTWQLDDGYWKQYASRGSVDSLQVVDLNGDGLGDIVSASSSVLAIYLSKRR